jgi:predicted enzyme related to lactoylglutathione lyase
MPEQHDLKLVRQLRRALSLVAAALALTGVLNGVTHAQPAGAPAINIPTTKGAMIMSAALEVSDLDRAVGFYTKVLGVRLGGHVEHPTSSEAILIFPGSATSLVLIKQKTAPAAEGRHLGRIIVLVPDLHVAQAQLEAAGYHLRQPITEQKDFKLSVALAADPDGNELELIQHG